MNDIFSYPSMAFPLPHALPTSSSTTELLIVNGRPRGFPLPNRDPCNSCTSLWPQVESPGNSGDNQIESSMTISVFSTWTNTPRSPFPNRFIFLRLDAGVAPSSPPPCRRFRRHIRYHTSPATNNATISIKPIVNPAAAAGDIFENG